MPSGSGAQVAITRAASLYEANVDPGSYSWAWTDFVSENIEHTYAELEEGAITGYKDAPPSYQGLSMAKGDVNLSPKPDPIGHFFRAVFGQSSSSLLMNAGSTGANSNAYAAGKPVFFHRFLPIQSNDSAEAFLPPYHFMTYRDQGSAWFYDGVQFHSLEMQIQAGQLVKAKTSMMARHVTRLARTSSIQNLAPTLGKPFVWDTASIQIGPSVSSLAANTNFESITLNLNVPLEGVVLLNGTKEYAEFQVNEFRRVAISGTISFRNQAEYDAFIAYQSRFLRVTLTNNASSNLMGNPASAYNPTIEIDIPQFKILTYQVPVQGPNRLHVQFTGKGERDPSSFYMIEAKITNVSCGY